MLLSHDFFGAFFPCYVCFLREIDTTAWEAIQSKMFLNPFQKGLPLFWILCTKAVTKVHLLKNLQNFHQMYLFSLVQWVLEHWIRALFFFFFWQMVVWQYIYRYIAGFWLEFCVSEVVTVFFWAWKIPAMYIYKHSQCSSGWSSYGFHQQLKQTKKKPSQGQSL